MTDNPNNGDTWSGTPEGQPEPPATDGQQPTQYISSPYGQAPYGQPQQGQAQRGPAQQGPAQQGPPYGQAPYGQPQYDQAQYGSYGVPPQPAGPSFFTELPLPFKLTLGSAIAGVVTYIMGFVAWVTIGEDIDRRAEDWAQGIGDQISIPAFLTVVFTPGYFLLFLGAAGVASFAFLVPKWRKYLPHVAALVVFAWLGLLACALGLPPFISLGAGAIVSLVLGSVQVALIGAAVILDGRNENR